MGTRSMPIEEVADEAIHILARGLGLADTARFLHHASGGLGNYTEERKTVLGDPSLDELIAEMEKGPIRQPS